MKLFQNLAEKAKKEFWSLSQDKLSRIFFYLLLLFLPTQLGKHFWPNFSFVYGIRLDYLSPTIYFTDLILFAIIVFSLKETLKKVNKSKHIKLFYLYIFILLIGIIVSKNNYAALFGLVKFLEFSYLFVYVVLNAKKLNKKVIFTLLFISLFFESLLSFLQVLNNGSLGGALYYLGERTFTPQTPGIANASINGSLYLRPYATFSHPNVLAFYLIAYQLLILNFFKKQKYQKYLIFLSLFLSSAAIFLTLGRITIFVWIINLVLIFYFQLPDKYKNKRKILFASIIIALVLVTLFLQKNIYAERLFSLSLKDQSYTQRVRLINQSTEIIKNNFIFGVGLNNFYYNLNPFFQNSRTFFIQPVHNIYLLVLAQTGIIGFLFFMYLIAKVLKKIKNKKYLFLLVLSTLFLGFFDHYLLTLEQGQLLFALILGLSLAG